MYSERSSIIEMCAKIKCLAVFVCVRTLYGTLLIPFIRWDFEKCEIFCLVGNCEKTNGKMGMGNLN